MNNDSLKIFLQIYGLARMILGVSQIVGLTAGYFLVEWLIKYPPHSVSFLLDADLVLLVYLAVFFRAVFHVVCGIGIARMASWTRSWILFGWPLVLLVIGGLIYSLSSNWIESGIMKNMFQAVSFPKAFIYLLFVFLDYTLVQASLARFEESQEESGLDTKFVTGIFLASLIFFILLLFLGKPIKQGFHKGYYKINGALEKEEDQGEIEVQTSSGRNEKKAIEQRKIEEKTAEQKIVISQNSAGKAAEQKTEEDEKKEDIPPNIPPENLNVPQDVSSRLMLGFLAGLALILGLSFQFYHLYQTRAVEAISPVAFLLLSLGFLLFMLYGMALHLLPVTFSGFFCMSLSVAVFIFKWKNPS
jgi:uncharacterized protein with PQ loop repeat